MHTSYNLYHYAVYTYIFTYSCIFLSTSIPVSKSLLNLIIICHHSLHRGLDIALVLLTFVERMAAGASMARSLPSIRLLRRSVGWCLNVIFSNHNSHSLTFFSHKISLDFLNSNHRLLRLIRAFKRMHKSKELVVLLSGTGKAARRQLGVMS